MYIPRGLGTVRYVGTYFWVWVRYVGTCFWVRYGMGTVRGYVLLGMGTVCRYVLLGTVRYGYGTWVRSAGTAYWYSVPTVPVFRKCGAISKMWR